MIISLLDRMTLEYGTVKEFLELLNLEADAMADGRFSDLPQLTERKSKLADEIVILGGYREAVQISLGYAAGYSGAVAAAADGEPLLQEMWGKLQTCAAQVRERNLANGVAIHANLVFNCVS
jgi:flagellar biosynthesis protein FlgN